MGVFGDIRGFFGRSGSVFMIIALAVADYLWGENVFNCPCGGLRILYTCAFLIVPPVVIILIDVSWKALVSTCRQNCCCPCGEHCQGACGCCCTCRQCCCDAKSTCCDYSTCETVVRLTARPVTIAFVWVIFGFMEPKFGKCLFSEVSCNCTEAELQNGCSISSKEKEATIRAVTAIVMLGLTAAVAIFSLTRILYILGLKPQTVITLQEQNLMGEMLLVNLSDNAVAGIDNSISVGQLEILRKHRKNIRLVKWLLQQNYSEDDIRQILEKDDLIRQILDNVRVSLNRDDPVPNDAVTNLREEINQRYGIVPANPAPEGDGRNVFREQAGEQAGEAQTGI